MSSARDSHAGKMLRMSEMGKPDTVRDAEPMAVSVAFIDLAGFSAIADVFGDRAAIAVLEIFEDLVERHSGEGGRLSNGSAMRRCLRFLIR